MAVKKPKFASRDIVWFFEADDDMIPSAWIRRCRVVEEATALFDPLVERYDIPSRFRARENQLFKTERAAHKHFCEWAEKIVDHERSWLLNHKNSKMNPDYTVFENICRYALMGTVTLLCISVSIVALVGLISSVLAAFLPEKRETEVLDAEIIDDAQLRGYFIRHGHKVQQIVNTQERHKLER